MQRDLNLREFLGSMHLLPLHESSQARDWNLKSNTITAAHKTMKSWETRRGETMQSFDWLTLHSTCVTHPTQRISKSQLEKSIKWQKFPTSLQHAWMCHQEMYRFLAPAMLSFEKKYDFVTDRKHSIHICFMDFGRLHWCPVKYSLFMPEFSELGHMSHYQQSEIIRTHQKCLCVSGSRERQPFKTDFSDKSCLSACRVEQGLLEWQPHWTRVSDCWRQTHASDSRHVYTTQPAFEGNFTRNSDFRISMNCLNQS